MRSTLVAVSCIYEPPSLLTFTAAHGDRSLILADVSSSEIPKFTKFQLFDLILARLEDLGLPRKKLKHITVLIHYVRYDLFGEEFTRLAYEGYLWDLRDIDKVVPGYSEWLNQR